MLSVNEAVQARKSTRAFLNKPVSADLLRSILGAAARSPSGGNLQPWNVHVMVGDDLAELKRKTRESLKGAREDGEFKVYPDLLPDTFNARRKKNGEDLYASIEVPREDKAGRLQQFARNYDFFGAPVGMIFAIDRCFDKPQWVHLGMFIQTVMLLAQEAGLGTCAQEAWSVWPKTVSAHLGLPTNLVVYCGMSLGYADEAHPINKFTTDRMPLDEFATFRGF